MVNHSSAYYSSKFFFFLFIILFVILTDTFLRITLPSLIPLFNGAYNNLSYTSFEISDWLISYEGGFVRRGLIGEFLYLIYNLYNYDVKLFILLTNASFFIWLAFLTYRVCHKLRAFSFPPLLIFCGVMMPFSWYRRDFLVLTLVYYIFMLFAKYLATGSRKSLFFFVILLSLCVLIHEASFFFTVPLLALLLWFKKDEKIFSTEKTKTCLAVFALPLITMAMTCFMKGSESIAQEIWESWTPIFLAYPESDALPEVGCGVAFLQRGVLSTAGYHLELNYCIWGYPLIVCIQRIIGVLISLYIIYFLFTYNPRIDFKKMDVSIGKQNGISNILLVQYFFMIPMFTILSCDFGRTIPYCVISSLFAYYHLIQNNICIHLPHFVSRLSIFSYNKQYDLNKALLWLYFTMVMFFPIRGAGGIEFPGNSYIFQRIMHFVTHHIISI